MSKPGEEKQQAVEVKKLENGSAILFDETTKKYQIKLVIDPAKPIGPEEIETLAKLNSDATLNAKNQHRLPPPLIKQPGPSIHINPTQFDNIDVEFVNKSGEKIGEGNFDWTHNPPLLEVKQTEEQKQKNKIDVPIDWDKSKKTDYNLFVDIVVRGKKEISIGKDDVETKKTEMHPLSGMRYKKPPQEISGLNRYTDHAINTKHSITITTLTDKGKMLAKAAVEHMQTLRTEEEKQAYLQKLSTELAKGKSAIQQRKSSYRDSRHQVADEQGFDGKPSRELKGDNFFKKLGNPRHNIKQLSLKLTDNIHAYGLKHTWYNLPQESIDKALANAAQAVPATHKQEEQVAAPTTPTPQSLKTTSPNQPEAQSLETASPPPTPETTTTTVTLDVQQGGSSQTTPTESVKTKFALPPADQEELERLKQQIESAGKPEKAAPERRNSLTHNSPPNSPTPPPRPRSPSQTGPGGDVSI